MASLVFQLRQRSVEVLTGSIVQPTRTQGAEAGSSSATGQVTGGGPGGRRVEQDQAVFCTCLSRRGDKAWWTWRAGWQHSDSKWCRGYCTYCLSLSPSLSLCPSLSPSLSLSLCLCLSPSLSLQISAQAAVEDSDQIFTELIRSIERRRSEVKELIRAQEKAQVSQAEGLLEQLKQEIAELRKRNTELEQLSHTEDHIHFLQLLYWHEKHCVNIAKATMYTVYIVIKLETITKNNIKW
uniref:TRIM8/14/16/25/29/45/65 coiled-coil region domain-containing protein n=1 Tax=Hucho hucho TaxID=62062 RepID=A0A4W5KD75_9TELE